MPAEPINESPKSQPLSQPAEATPPAEDFAPGTSPPEGNMEETVKKLREENTQLTDHLLRKQAEIENFRKRTEREKEDFMQYSLFNAVKDLLPVLDGFELALGSDGGGEDYRKGVALIYQKLSGALQKLGLKPVESKGREFDPRLHEAVATVESDEHAEHEIVEELQRGYFFKDRLLRPAMVTVAKRRT